MQNTPKVVLDAYKAYISEGIADSDGNFIPVSLEAFKAQKHAELVATFAPEAVNPAKPMAKQETDSRTVAGVDALDMAKSLLEMKHLAHSQHEINVLANDLELVRGEFNDEAHISEATAILRDRIGGWQNLQSYMKCILIGK